MSLAGGLHVYPGMNNYVYSILCQSGHCNVDFQITFYLFGILSHISWCAWKYLLFGIVLDFRQFSGQKITFIRIFWFEIFDQDCENLGRTRNVRFRGF